MLSDYTMKTIRERALEFEKEEGLRPNVVVVPLNLIEGWAGKWKRGDRIGSFRGMKCILGEKLSVAFDPDSPC